jgi:serine/threonine-protein kinase
VADQLERLREALAGHYEVDRLLGQGGMAFVYLARDAKHERSVAIKVLKPELGATIGAERFLREIRVAAQLQHPNILGLYDSGVADGLLYYVMPFIEGESLRDRLMREHQLPIEDALRIVRESAEALQYAHNHKIIHRDIKPENILLQGGHALVADFGIARAVESAGSKLTETGMAVGTPHYMSPEQSLGGDMDGRSDEYSLGCVLYELLVGQPPFDGPNAMAVLARHSLEQVPSMQVVRNSIPDAVEDATFRALEKTPADRFASMKEFAEALGEAEAEASLLRTSSRRANTPRTPQHVPIGTRRTTARIMRPGGTGHTPAAEFEAVEEPKPRRTWLIVGAVVALLAIAGIAGRQFLGGKGNAISPAVPGDDGRRIAVLYFQTEGGGDSLQFLANGLTEGLISRLSQVGELDVISRNGVAPFRGSTLQRDSIARLLKVGTLVEGSVEQEKDRIRVTVRLVDAASGAEFQRASFEQPASQYLTLGDSLAQKAAVFLRERLGAEVRLREQRQQASNPQAWILVQRADAFSRQADSLTLTDPKAAARAYEQADSLLAQASVLDPKWTAPLVQRGTITSQEVRLVNTDPVLASPYITKGLGFVEQALAIDPQDADALFQRGELRYWQWLLGLEVDPAAANKLLESAQADLELSVRINPSEARAWAALSHLYNQTKGPTDAKLAALRAFEEDAYLANIDKVIDRLFFSSYDLAQFADAKQWCDEGQRRFPTDYRFTTCHLRLLATRAEAPDVPRAWRLRDSVEALAPEQERQFRALTAQMLVAAVLARAKLADSARSVVQRSRGSAEIDPTHDLAEEAAYVYTLLGDNPAAFKALKTYWTANPSQQKAMADNPGWKFEPLRSDPDWRRVVGAP